MVALLFEFYEEVTLVDTVVTEEMKRIHLINGRCGGNKTGYIVAQIESALSENPDQCIIYAAPTKLVLNEVYSNRLLNLEASSKQLIVSDDSINESVTSTITKVLSEGYCGCLLITHSALFNLDATLLAGKWVIIDESPEQTVRFTTIDFFDNEPPHEFQRFNELTVVCDANVSQHYSRIIPSSTENVQLLFDEGNRLRSKSYNLTKMGKKVKAQKLVDIAGLCFAAASEHGYIYLSSKADDELTKLIYRSIETGDMVRVVNHASKVWLASADFEGGLLHFLLTNYHGLSIESIENTGIPLEHDKTNVTILPLLGGDKQWSKTFAESNRAALEGFDFSDISNYSCDKTVFTELFEFGTFSIQAEIHENKEHQTKSLMFVNVAKQSECKHDDFVQVSTQSHGQNSYQMHNHAIWMASLLPNPNQIKALEYFCRQVSIDTQTAKECLLHTRQYAPMYQGLARTSLRVEASTDPNLFVVPDSASAEALLKWIPNATIDTKYLFTLGELKEKQQEFDAKKEQRRSMAYAIFYDLLTVKHGRKADVYKRFGVDRKQVSDLKKEFKDDLFAANLLPEALDEQRVRDVQRLMQDEGMTMNKACKTVGIDRNKYLRDKAKYSIS
ncbi:hypothetical protein Sbal223_1808 [Shewanella baltica OS223]|uniref:hypothetical protein n=1 Tax=Shewanella baltica TaxID=62322 RepID=UPI0001531007|nr:hypothetical protein [Shewanella baltica]ACK46313.1 hypothetical protein Sbal223_1808 [Shewanella baltica OS223]